LLLSGRHEDLGHRLPDLISLLEPLDALRRRPDEEGERRGTFRVS
jgi:hypothetical protein